MIYRSHRPFAFLLTLCGSASLAVYAPQARADVFEISAEGQWRQVNKSPFAPADIPAGYAKSGAEQSPLPPVRLAAITTINEPIAAQQSYALNSGPASGKYAAVINAAAKQYGISPALVDAVMWQESRYNQRAISSAGAIGLMQLMPGTAQNLGVNPHDPWQNVFGGAAYLRKQLDRFGNNVPLALAAYNAGPGAVIKHNGVPPYTETRNYVRTIMRRLMNQNAMQTGQ
jgi:soluble lytic murein transglycosylase-like protein